MTKREIDQEFNKIDLEFHKKRPMQTPFPPNVVKRRELLLFAQVHLNKILEAKLKKDQLAEKFQTEMYRIVMLYYYNW